MELIGQNIETIRDVSGEEIESKYNRIKWAKNRDREREDEDREEEDRGCEG